MTTINTTVNTEFTTTGVGKAKADTKKIQESYETTQIAMMKLARATKVSTETMRIAMQNTGMVFKKEGKNMQLLDVFGNKGNGALLTTKKGIKKLQPELVNASRETNKFKMEHLGLMFAFMASGQIFSTQISKVRALTGYNEVMDATYTQMLIPSQVQMTRLAMGFNSTLSLLPPSIQGVIGTSMQLFTTLSHVGFAWFQLELAMQSARKENGLFRTVIMGPMSRAWKKTRLLIKKTTKEHRKYIKALMKTRKGTMALTGTQMSGATLALRTFGGAIKSCYVALIPIIVAIGGFISANATILLVVGLVIAALAILAKNWTYLKKATSDSWDAISKTISETMNTIKEYIDRVITDLKTKWATITAPFREAMDKIVAILEQNQLYNSTVTMIGKLKSVWTGFKTFISTLFSALEYVILAPFMKAYNAIISAAQTLVSNTPAIVQPLIPGFQVIQSMALMKKMDSSGLANGLLNDVQNLKSIISPSVYNPTTALPVSQSTQTNTSNSNSVSVGTINIQSPTSNPFLLTKNISNALGFSSMDP